MSTSWRGGRERADEGVVIMGVRSIYQYTLRVGVASASSPNAMTTRSAIFAIRKLNFEFSKFNFCEILGTKLIHVITKIF